MRKLVIAGILALAVAVTAQPAMAKHMSKAKQCPCPEAQPSMLDRAKSAVKKAVEVVKPEPSTMTLPQVDKESP